MFRWLGFLALAVAVSGCASLNLKRPVADEDLSKIRRVGVVSILGNTFSGISIGTTVFNNSSFSAPVPDWNVDGHAASTALDLLRKNARFESALVDRGSLSAAELGADGAKRLWEAAEKQGFDKVVIVRPGVSDNHLSFRPGFGLYERSMLGLSRRCVYAGYVVDVYDVATRKPIAWEWGGGMPCAVGSDDKIVFKPKFDDYSADERSTLRQRLEARLSESLRYSLEKLSLIAAAK
jgi:hypothetical protein